jgi:hypothetical protein
MLHAADCQTELHWIPNVCHCVDGMLLRPSPTCGASPQVLVCVYADDSTIGKDTLIGSNYVKVADLMAMGDKAERTDKKLGCKLFPEAVFRGETFTDVRTCLTIPSRIHTPASASAFRLFACHTARKPFHRFPSSLRGTYTSTLTSRSSPHMTYLLSRVEHIRIGPGGRIRRSDGLLLAHTHRRSRWAASR